MKGIFEFGISLSSLKVSTKDSEQFPSSGSSMSTSRYFAMAIFCFLFCIFFYILSKCQNFEFLISSSQPNTTSRTSHLIHKLVKIQELAVHWTWGKGKNPLPEKKETETEVMGERKSSQMLQPMSAEVKLTVSMVKCTGSSDYAITKCWYTR